MLSGFVYHYLCMLDALFLNKPLLIKHAFLAAVARSNLEKFLAAQTSRVTRLHENRLETVDM